MRSNGQLAGCNDTLERATLYEDLASVELRCALSEKTGRVTDLLPVCQPLYEDVPSYQCPVLTYLEQPCAQGQDIVLAALLLGDLGGESHWGCCGSLLLWGSAI